MDNDMGVVFVEVRSAKDKRHLLFCVGTYGNQLAIFIKQKGNRTIYPVTVAQVFELFVTDEELLRILGTPPPNKGENKIIKLYI